MTESYIPEIVHPALPGLRPRKGWPEETWWCQRCATVWRGQWPWAHGCCPQPRPDGINGRCNTLLLRLGVDTTRRLRHDERVFRTRTQPQQTQQR